MPKKSRTQSTHSDLLPVLKLDDLCRRCDPATLGFSNTNDLPDLTGVIGQPRALRALDLGSEVTGTGYNIFVLGLPGSGRTTLSREYLEGRAIHEPVPEDWCYLNNFDEPRKPKALRLQAGQGTVFRKDISDFIQFCLRVIPDAFKSKEYLQERERLVEELNNRQEAEFQHLQEHAEKFSFMIARTPVGILLVPAAEGKPLKPEEIAKLSQEQKEKLENLQYKLSKEVDNSLERLRILARQANDKSIELNRATIIFHIGPELESLVKKYASSEDILQHLQDLKDDILEHVELFQSSEDGDPRTTEARISTCQQRYSINLMVDNSNLKGAPVIVETNPIYPNLLGRIEHEMIMGASRTDFTKIHPGALHLANGGYLILPARDLLNSPYAWDGVKRVLRDESLRIIEIGSQIGIISTETLEPQPIPLKIKIILIGTPIIYYLLQLYDEDFSKLFKVRAEFGALMERTPEAEHDYGLFVKSVVIDNQLPPFDNTAVARIIEFSSRLAEDQGKLSTRFGRIADLVRESAYWARKNGDYASKHMITARSVERAIEEAIYRHNLLDDQMQELLAKDTLMVSVTGTAVGQVNALSVISQGDYAFGRPSRLSATVAPGKSGVMDIERQAKLGGPIHTKGVLILSGYLNSHYTSKGPLSLSASITFEQSYSEIEGDSASAAELFALLSAIANLPLRQDLAVTGSVNQFGQIQAIGGVNEKIEGFFATCTAKGLTGTQGVIIPNANIRHLMLRQDVIQSVEHGHFHIYPIKNIEQGIQLLSGLVAGQQDGQGSYPHGSFNQAVVSRLEKFSELMKEIKNENQKS